MDWRNPKYNQFGTIDIEVNHPRFGWIPFTAEPTDPEQSGRDLHATVLAAGGIAPYVAPTPPTAADISAMDLANLNEALSLPGSIVRALGLVTFQEINKLRAQAGLTQYTMTQFINALKANIR